MSKGLIKIKSQSIAMCPSLFEVVLPDGSDGRLKYRWGVISLIKNEGRAMFDTSIEEEQIGEGYSGNIELDCVVNWLESRGYQVDVNEFQDLTDMCEL